LGGTLVAGGISGRSFSRGLLADHVLEVELMGADGQLWKCRSETNSDIFSYSLGTMGMNGAILTAKITTEPLLPYRVQLVTKNLPIASFLPMCEELRGVPEVVSVEGFINLGSRQTTANVYIAIEAENQSMVQEKAEKWREIAKRLPVSSYSIRVVHIDDALGFSASLAGWKPRAPRNLKMNLMNKKFAPYAAPVPVAFDTLEAISFIKNFMDYVVHHSHFFLARPYFAMITSMKQSQFPWLQLSKRDPYVIGLDLFVTFPHFKKARGKQILNHVASMAAEHHGRIYPYGFLPETELLSRLLPDVSEQMKQVAVKTDPEHVIKPVLPGIRATRKRKVSKTRKSMPERRFRAYGVGIAKSGTTSVAGIFSNYRAGHEFMFPETTKAISDYRTGVISKKEFMGFLKARDQLGNLEMDSASFNFMYADLLAEAYPDAKFIVTIRDCYSWLDSALNMFLLLDIPDWMIDYGSRSFGVTITREMFSSRQSLLKALPGILDGILGYWAYGIQFILDNLPGNRCLVIRTEEISGSLDRIAGFLSIPRSTLVKENSHLFKATTKFNILHDMDPNLLKENFEEHCAPFMRKYFPDQTLEAFLEIQKKDRMRASGSKPVERHPHETRGRRIKAPLMGDYLFELIKTLKTEYALERSFKISEKTLIPNRLLFGIYTNRIKENQYEKLLDICQQINMPEDFLEIFEAKWHDSNAIGWAFEKIEDEIVYKVYLEFWDKWKRDVRDTPKGCDPFVVLLGFKWVASNRAKSSLARYTLHPHLTYEGMLERLSATYETDRHRALFEIVRDFLGFASRKVPHDEIRYLEVTEENTPRKSFDINVYNAKLLLKQIYPLLQKIYQHYSIPAGEFHALYNLFRTKTVGHLSGGIGRDGKDFVTLYYGLEDVLDVREG